MLKMFFSFLTEFFRCLLPTDSGYFHPPAPSGCSVSLVIGCLGVQFIDVWVSAIVSGVAAYGVTFDPPIRSTPVQCTAAIYGWTSEGPWSCRLQVEIEE